MLPCAEKADRRHKKGDQEQSAEHALPLYSLARLQEGSLAHLVRRGGRAQLRRAGWIRAGPDRGY